MNLDSPPVDPRSREDVAVQVRRMLGVSIPGWPQQSSGAAADALISVFSQFCGIVINRLNLAPRKNFLAFLDMLGVSPLPREAARVPLTFHSAAQQENFVTVPAGTQIAAAPEKGEEQPVIFETEQNLVVTSAVLDTIEVKDGRSDSFGDYSAILIQASPNGVAPFGGVTPMEHHLYIALPLPSPPPPLDKVQLATEIDAAQGLAPESWVEWGIWRGDDPKTPPLPLSPSLDTTQQLTRSGEIEFQLPPAIPEAEVDGRKGYWLRCRATRPLPAGTAMPRIRSLTVRLTIVRESLRAEAAVANAVTLDPTKDFFPFGKQPAFNDTLYLANAEAFSKRGGVVKLRIVLTNPGARGDSASPIPAVATQNAEVLWEVWDGVQWLPAGLSQSGRPVAGDGAAFADTTEALTKSGEVRLRIPETTASLNIAGATSYWVRARLIGGHYGRPAHYTKGSKGEPELVPESFAPPAIKSVDLSYTLHISAPPTALVGYDDFTHHTIQAGPFAPFVPAAEAAAHCYFGFAPDKPVASPAISIYFGAANPSDRKDVFTMATGPAVTLLWEYWNGKAWVQRSTVDDTDAFRRSGIVTLLPPPDLETKWEFAKKRYWFRVRPRDANKYQPRLRLVALNTVMASQRITLTDEVLGSSNGSAGQRFRATKVPILAGQRLEVLEPGMPSVEALRKIREEEGDDAIRRNDRIDLRGPGFWVRWHQVPQFNGSGPHDRHYVLDRETGDVSFGDGVNGRVPAAGVKNIVLAVYRTGGGAAGNRKEHTVEQLKTAIPYIDRVTNLEPAGGGADAESLDRVLSRAPRELRHGFRAVSAQDFEDLAFLASPEVARARAVPLYNLAVDPDAKMPRVGIVSLIIAPVSHGMTGGVERPMPSMALIRRVRDFLDARRTPDADLVIIGPEYVAIHVETEIAVSDADRASITELAVSEALSRFLHPALGRFDGSGWSFGQEPEISDLYALIENVPGVDHVRELKATPVEDRPGAHRTGYFLICAGEPRITVTLEK